MKRFYSILIGLILAIQAIAAPVKYYVSASGNDSNNGLTLATAKATVANAKATVVTRIAAGYPADGITIYVSPSAYKQLATMTFTAADGAPSSLLKPVEWIGVGSIFQPSLIHAGQQIPTAAFATVTSSDPNWGRLNSGQRAAVQVVSLPGLSPTITDYGTISTSHQGHSVASSVVAPLEVFVDGKALDLAEWDYGTQYPPYISANNGAREYTIHNTWTVPTTWARITEVVTRGTIAGEFEDRWVLNESRVGNTFTAVADLTFASTVTDRRVYFTNILEEISPGEHYIDRTNGRLYVYPQTAFTPTTQVWVSQGTFDLVTINGAKNIKFKGLDFAYTRRHAFFGSSAELVAENIRWVNCRIYGTGIGGIILGDEFGNDSRTTPSRMVTRGIWISNCEIHDTGGSAVVLNSGRRTTLTSGESFIWNNQIENVSRRFFTGRPGIFSSGVSTVIANNYIKDAWGIGIFFRGNNNQILLNELIGCYKRGADYGIIYGGNRSIVDRGNVIKWNLLHDNFTSHSSQGDHHGIYIDDVSSGQEIESNIVWDTTGTAIYATGGRDNIVRNNVIDTAYAVFHNDDRARTRTNGSEGTGTDWDLITAVTTVSGGTAWTPGSDWYVSYPPLRNFPQSWTEANLPTKATSRWWGPEGTVYEGNTYRSVTTPLRDTNGVSSYFAVNRNNTQVNPATFGITEANIQDRSLRPATITTPNGAVIPYGRIGRLPGADGEELPTFEYTQSDGTQVRAEVAPFASTP